MKNIMKKLVIVTGMTVLSITSFAASVNNGDKKLSIPKEQQVQNKKKLPLKKSNTQKLTRPEDKKNSKSRQKKPLKKNSDKPKSNVKKPLSPQENIKK